MKAKAYPGMVLGSSREITSQKQAVSLSYEKLLASENAVQADGLMGAVLSDLRHLDLCSLEQSLAIFPGILYLV